MMATTDSPNTVELYETFHHRHRRYVLLKLSDKPPQYCFHELLDYERAVAGEAVEDARAVTRSPLLLLVRLLGGSLHS